MNRAERCAIRIERWYAARTVYSGQVGKHAAKVIAALRSISKWEITPMEAQENRKRLHTTVTIIVTVVALAVVLFGWLTIRSRGLANWGNDFTARGQFGDSFGELSALFAGLALIAASLAACFQWIAMRDDRADAAAEAVESHFFQMLGNLQTTLNETRIDINGYVGRQATRKIADWLLTSLKDCRNHDPAIADNDRLEDIRKSFQYFYDGKTCQGGTLPAPAVDLMGHIFRLIYHILKYVNSRDAISRKDKITYAGILRAHLSNPELAMLFYNCLTKHGYDKHFPLLAGYRMFKNLNRTVLVEPAGDWNFYLRLVQGRSTEIKTVVGHLPAEQGPPEI